jgi:Tfp pilus assembly protein PilF
MHTESEQFSQALKILEEGLIANPDSAALHISMAFVYTEMGNYRQAEILLNKAERLDPESPLVHSFRESLNLRKAEQKHAHHKMSKPLKQKAKKRIKGVYHVKN